MQPSFSSNEQLVDYLVEQGKINSEEVEEAFRQVDRSEFVPEDLSEDAYTDKPVPLNGETISAPHIVAIVTELLDLNGDEKVLEIGSGSGYQAAILGKIAGKVVGVEINGELAEQSRNRVPENVEIRAGNGFEEVGKPESESFSKILFSCATEDFETAEKYVKEDGIIVGPVKKGRSQLLKKWDSGRMTDHGGVRYVEMQD